MYIDESQESNVIVHEPITGNNEVLDTQYDGLLDNYGIFDSQEYFLSSDKKDKQEEFDKTKENKLEEINNEDNETKDIIGASSGTYRTYHSILSKKSKKSKEQPKKQTKKQRYSESFKIDNDHIPPFNSMKGRELFRYTIPYLYDKMVNFMKSESNSHSSSSNEIHTFQNDLSDFLQSNIGIEFLEHHFKENGIKSSLFKTIKSMLNVNISSLDIIQAKDDCMISQSQLKLFIRHCQFSLYRGGDDDDGDSIDKRKINNFYKFFIGPDKLGTESALFTEAIEEELKFKIHDIDDNASYVNIEDVIKLFIEVLLAEGNTIENNHIQFRFSFDGREISWGNIAFFIVPLGFSKTFPTQHWKSGFPFIIFTGDEKIEYYLKYCDTILEFTCKDKQTIIVDNIEYTIEFILTPDLKALKSSEILIPFEIFKNLEEERLLSLLKAYNIFDTNLNNLQKRIALYKYKNISEIKSKKYNKLTYTLLKKEIKKRKLSIEIHDKQALILILNCHFNKSKKYKDLTLQNLQKEIDKRELKIGDDTKKQYFVEKLNKIDSFYTKLLQIESKSIQSSDYSSLNVTQLNTKFKERSIPNIEHDYLISVLTNDDELEKKKDFNQVDIQDLKTFMVKRNLPIEITQKSALISMLKENDNENHYSNFKELKQELSERNISYEKSYDKSNLISLLKQNDSMLFSTKFEESKEFFIRKMDIVINILDDMNATTEVKDCISIKGTPNRSKKNMNIDSQPINKENNYGDEDYKKQSSKHKQETSSSNSISNEEKVLLKAVKEKLDNLVQHEFSEKNLMDYIKENLKNESVYSICPKCACSRNSIKFSMLNPEHSLFQEEFQFENLFNIKAIAYCNLHASERIVENVLGLTMKQNENVRNWVVC